MMIKSGIAPLDERLGGLLPGRTYVLSGAPGTGKSIACLEFLNAALEEGATAAILTHDDPGDLIAQGEFLGLDLDRALREERFVLLRYQLDFSRRFCRAPSPEVAFDELRRLLGDHTPSRIAIDSMAPFLEGSAASGSGVSAMLAFLESLGATSLLTYPGDLAGLFDRRIEPLVQRAAAILHLTAESDRTGRIEVRKVRFSVPSTAPVSFRIQPGAGISALGDVRQRRADDVSDDRRRRVLVLDLSNAFPEELLVILRARYDVAVRHRVASAFSDLAQSAVGAVVLDVSRDTVSDALALVRELRRGGNRSPIVLVTQYTLRSADRARALRAGADEFLSADMRTDEFALRMEGVVARGRSPLATSADVEVPIVTQREDEGQPVPFDAAEFREAVDAHLRHDAAPFFTMVSVRPRRAADAGALRTLCGAVLRTLRVDGGDLAGTTNDGVVAYLHCARRKDVAPFIERVRAEWRRAGHGELDVTTATYPAEEAQVRSLLETSAR